MSPASTALSQPAPPPRDDYVFHVYVNPLHGDDARAWSQNPGIGTNIPPLGYHPDITSVPRPVGGLLQHAPYAFKTLTGTQGAMAYIRQLTTQYGSGNPRQLPWSITIKAGVVKTVRQVVVHCLPGVYGPILSGQPGIDPRSGLPFNGETWPVTLDNHVSLQGASALDTVFDARHQATAVVVVQMPFGTRDLSHDDSMIDGLTIRGARSDEKPMSPQNLTGAGIYIGRESRIAVTISNCILTDNAVAIAVDCDDGGPSDPFPNEPRIVNNTIAWNKIGVWNGNTGATLFPPQPNVGLSTPVLLNNVFDTGTPYPSVLPSLSAFEGVHPFDLTVTSRTLGGATTSFGISFNAWEAGFANGGASGGANWPAPAQRAPLAPPVPPGVDLTAYTKLAGGARGSLYVSDVFRHAAAAGVPRLSADHSPHDFRLAPSASATTAAPPAPPADANPLVDHGLWLPPGPGPSYITMANGIVLSAAPGLPASAEDFATLHAWDEDAEGFGNPRVVAHSAYPPPPPPFPDRIDLGADELGELLMAGFLDGTRIFSAQVPNAPGIANHLDVYFFARKSSASGGGPFPRPVYNSWTGRTWTWWAHVQGAPDALSGPTTRPALRGPSWRWSRPERDRPSCGGWSAISRRTCTWTRIRRGGWRSTRARPRTPAISTRRIPGTRDWMRASSASTTTLCCTTTPHLVTPSTIRSTTGSSYRTPAPS